MTPSLAAGLLALLAAAQASVPAPAGAAPGEVALSRLESAALARVRDALPQRTTPVLSGPLVEAARTIARAAARGEARPLASAALRSALGEAGVFDPAPAAVLLSSAPASLPDALAAAARIRGATHMGVGVEVRDGLAWAALLASERRAELDPFPRRVAPGTRAVLRGTLLRLDSPRVWVATPAGAAREIPVEVEGRRFQARVALDEPGWWRVEVGGDGPRGPTVAALLEVACGDVPAPAPPGRPEADPPGPGAAAARIRAEVDALRVRQGLPPLVPDPALDREARLHSEAMLAAGTLAHRIDGGPDLLSRIAAAGVAYRSARENVARGDGALDAHRATVESPAHLANLLAPGAMRMGLGIARGTLPGGQPVVYLTEILVEPRDGVPAGGGPAGGRRRRAPRPGAAASRSSRCSTRSAAGWRTGCSACTSSCSRPASPPRRDTSRSSRRRGSGGPPPRVPG
jgi:hypothetical protein